jgi:hypothetical protein
LIEEREAVTEKLYDCDTALMTSPSPKSHLSAGTAFTVREQDEALLFSCNQKRNCKSSSVFAL